MKVMKKSKKQVDRRPLPDQVILTRAARSVATVMSAISESSGQDCILHAQLLLHLLSDKGITSEVVFGRAAWRHGPEDGAVVAHMPEAECRTTGHFAGHAWIELRGFIILDCTLWSLPRKIAVLESMDGRRTTNRWTFPVLLAEKAQVSDFLRVRDGHGIAAFYSRDNAMRVAILPQVEPPDPYLLTAVETVYANPGIEVIGVS
jgi:hypothetical protein